MTAAARRRRLTAPLNRSATRGSSLILTLLIVTVLSIIVAAFLQSMSIERAVAKSTANRLRAEMAADSGLQILSRIIQQNTGNDTFLVLRSGDDDYIGSAVSANSPSQEGTARVVPLFSFSTNASLLNQTLTMSAHSLANQTKAAPLKTFNGLGAAGGNASATWVTLTDNTGKPVGRFAYWAEDLSSRLNAAHAGNNMDSGRHLRETGTNVSEIPLFPLFGNTTQTDPGTTPAAQILALRNKFITPSHAGQITGVTPQIQNHLTLFRTGDSEQDLVPFGFGYANEGQPKANLNSLVAAGNVNGIVSVIQSNLPNFAAERRGGMGSSDQYLRNLAASIIDYADTDSNSTAGSGYRGVDAFPYINEVYDHCTAVWPASPEADGIYYVRVFINPYVEVWNPSNLPVTGSATFFYDLSGQSVTVNGIPRPLGNMTVTRSITLSPNSFDIITLGPQEYKFPWGATPPASNANMPMPAPNPGVLLELQWGGVAVDRQQGRMNRAIATTGIARTGGNVNHWRGNAIGPSDYSIGQTADPRISYFNTASWFRHTYSGSDGNTSWKGRNMLRAEPNTTYNQQKVSAWPDGGTDTRPGVKATGSTQTPVMAAGSAPAAEPDKAPQFLSNSGNYSSIMELGNIFDPAQWAFSINRTGVPVDIPASATANSTAGGGLTLAIGRREFSKFDKPGARASQLLDLFTVTPLRPTDGLVNINTATRETLRSLAVGLMINRTATIGQTAYGYVNPAEIAPPTAAAAADLVADAIIASRPFFSRSQLNLASRTASGKSAPWSEKFFGNPNAWPSGGPSVQILQSEGGDFTTLTSGWNDRAAESLLARIYNLVTIRSRVFRVVVCGQAFTLNSQGNPVMDASNNPRIASSATKEYIIYARPERDNNGKVLSSSIVILHEKDI